MRIERCGDRAFLVRLGERPEPALSRRIAVLRERLVAARPAGLDDAVPGFVTLLVLYDPDVTTSEALCGLVRELLPRGETDTPRRTWTLPVCYDASLAPDLETVAAAAKLSPDEVMRLHAGRAYTVYLIGFSPGFPYLGDLDARLVLPRRAEPRPRVPAGSVAIATSYTAVYPQDTAGGWHLVGRTPARMFDAAGASPALLRPGDAVRFQLIGRVEYEALSSRAAAGDYVPEFRETMP